MRENLGTLLNPTRRFCNRALLAFFLFLITATACAAYAHWNAKPPVPGKDVALMMYTVFGYCLALVAIIVWISLIFLARRMDRDLDAYRAGNFLYHFTYPRDLWEAYVANEKQVGGKNALKIAAIVAASGVIVGIAAGAGWGDSGKYAVGTITFLVMLGIAALIYFGADAWANHKARRLLESSGNAVIAAHSAYLNGQWQFWHTRVRRLSAVDLQPGPMPILQFTIVWTYGTAGQAMQIAALAAGRYVPSQYIQYLRIPLPPNYDPAAVLADLKVRLTP